jgi:hypothetical protein
VLQLPHDLGQMAAVPDLDAEEHRDETRSVGTLHRHVVDVALRIGDRGREIGQQAAAVGDQEADARVEHAFDIRRPVDVDELIGVAALLLERDAVAQVHDESLALAELADDLVAGIGRQHLPYWIADAFDTAERQRGGLRHPRAGG